MSFVGVGRERCRDAPMSRDMAKRVIRKTMRDSISCIKCVRLALENCVCIICDVGSNHGIVGGGNKSVSSMTEFTGNIFLQLFENAFVRLYNSCEQVFFAANTQR